MKIRRISKKKEDNSIIGMILNMLFKGFSLLLSVIYVPIVLDFLGPQKNGVWMTILSLLSWVSYFDVGIGNGLKNKLTENLTKKESCKSLVSSAFFIFFVIASFMTIVFIAISYFINWNIVFGIDACDENLRLIVDICIIFISLNFIFSNCRIILYAIHKSYYIGLLEVSSQVFFMVFIIILKRFAHNLFLISIIYGISLVFVNLLCCICIFINNRDFCPSMKYVRVDQGKKLTQVGVKFFIVQLCALILFSTDNLIVSILFGSECVTPYSIVIKIFTVVIGVHSAFLSPVWTDVTRAKEKNDINYISRLSTKMLLLIIPFVIFTIFVYYFFGELLVMWLGYEMFFPRYLVLFGLIYCVLSLWCNTWACFTNGLELLRFSVVFAVVQAVANIPLSVFFAENMKLESSGVLLGTIMSMVIAAIAAPIRIFIFINTKRKEMEL